MEKILLTKGIELASLQDEEDGMIRNYVYTKDLLDRKIYIEYYTSDLAEDEAETAIFVHALTKDCSYLFTITVHIDIIEMAPMRLFRIIVDVVDFIKTCPITTVIDDLKTISTGSSCSKEWEDKEEGKRIFQVDQENFNTVIKMIELKKSSLN